MITSGDVCIGNILSGKYQRHRLPIDKKYIYEKEDKYRFISFLESGAQEINRWLDEPFNPDNQTSGLGFTKDKENSLCQSII